MQTRQDEKRLNSNRHYSLRKLSVGLASVLIGISFLNGTKTTVNADTITASTKTGEVSKAGNLEVAGDSKDLSAFSMSFNGKNGENETAKADTTSDQTTQTGDQAETKNQENKLVDQINYKLTNNTSTDHKEDLGQNLTAPDETKSTSTTKSDAEKSIVSPSSAQKINNQSNDHADDNSQSQLNITKNSQQFTKKELATNLTETNNLPSFGSASLDDRATGTKNTRVGDTRLSNDQLKHIAISSDIKLTPNGHTDKPYKDGQIANIKINQSVSVGLTGTTTIDKNDLKKGNNILIGTVQMSNDRYGQVYDKVPDSELNMNNVIGGIGYDSQFESHEPEVANASYQQAVNIDYDGKQLGRVTIAGLHDKNEFDIYLHVDNEFDFVTDPTFTFKQNFFLAINNLGGGQNSAVFTGIKPKDSLNVQFDTNTHKYQVHFNYAQINAPLVTTVGTNDSNTISIDTSAKRIYLNNGVASHFFNTDKYGNYDPNNFTFKDNGEYDEAIKITSSSNNSITNIISYARANKFVRNADNKALGGDLDTNWGEHAIATTRKADNLTAKDLLDQTPAGTASWSKQADGSVIVAEKLIRSNFTSIPINLASKTWATTAVDPNHAQQIIQNTNKHVNDHNWTNNIWFCLANNNATTITVTDITPQSYSHYVGHEIKSTLGTTDSNGSGSTTAETWRYANISYVDDDDNETEMNKNTIQGLRDKGTEYTIQIPKGYLLDTNTDSTNYKWNADHTKITYTFADNQSLNEKNPIIIHLKHKHTAVTDPSQLHATGKRTITVYLPHHDQPMIIVQTVGYKRTGDLDEATNTPTYTDWKVDADTSNVTVDGQSSTQYQAYILKDGVVNYAPIKLPHINGYKAKLIQDKANLAMFMVSFVALPQQNNQSNNVQSSQKPVQAEQKQPEPVQTAPATKQTKAGYKPVLQTVRPNMLSFIFMPIAKPPVEVNLDTPEKFSANDATVSLLPTWHLVENNMPDYTYTLTNTINSLNLPKIKDYKLYLVNKESQDNTVAFTYLKNNDLKYLFKIKFINNSFEFSVKNVDKDVISVYKFNNLKDLDKFLVKFVTAA